MKKMQKKARQDSKSKDGDSGDEKKPKVKEEDSMYSFLCFPLAVNRA